MSPATIALVAELLASIGKPVSVRRVCAVLQAVYGKAARWSEIRAAILAWQQQSGNIPATLGQQFSRGTGNIPATSRQHSHASARADLNGVMFELADSELLRNSSSASFCNDVEKRVVSKTTKQPMLPFDASLLDARRAIIDRIWGLLQPLIARSTPKGDWVRRNNRVASSLASGGFTPDQVERAWHLASKERGEPVRELSLLQSYIARVEATVAINKAVRK